MSKRSWVTGPGCGIVQDPDNQKITIFAGSSALELDGKEGVLALASPIREQHGGDRREDGLLRRQASFMGLIPSTTFTPTPQLTLDIPIQGIAGLITDIGKMASLLMG